MEVQRGVPNMINRPYSEVKFWWRITYVETTIEYHIRLSPISL
uniref:Uncharacterized protein n=1 Tax=Arundo donax TaxID=35708 RepID=A0A0A8ZQ09_ARUDO